MLIEDVIAVDRSYQSTPPVGGNANYTLYSIPRQAFKWRMARCVPQ